MKPLAYGAIAALVLVTALGYWLFGGDPVATRYRTAAVERGPVVSTVTASGSVAAMVTVDVSSQLSGQVARIEADYNAEVEQDQVLARLDPQSYEARVRELEAELEVAQASVLMQRGAVAQAEAELANSEGTLAVLTNRAASHRANYTDLEQELERLRSLKSQSAVSVREVQKAEAERDSARALLGAANAEAQVQQARIRSAAAAVDIAKAGVSNAEAVVKQRQAALDQARVDLERTVIRSPIAGIVISRDVDVGQTVAASLQAPTLFTIAGDLGQIKVEASVDEADIGRVQAGQRVEFRVDAYPERSFSGTVAQVRKAPQAFQNVVTYLVVIEAANRDQALFPGMTGLVRIVVAERPDALRVPNAALRFRPLGALAGDPGGAPPGQQVWVLKGGRPAAIAVTAGETDGSITAVASDALQPGDQVILGAVRAAP